MTKSTTDNFDEFQYIQSEIIYENIELDRFCDTSFVVNYNKISQELLAEIDAPNYNELERKVLEYIQKHSVKYFSYFQSEDNMFQIEKIVRLNKHEYIIFVHDDFGKIGFFGLCYIYNLHKNKRTSEPFVSKISIGEDEDGYIGSSCFILDKGKLIVERSLEIYDSNERLTELTKDTVIIRK